MNFNEFYPLVKFYYINICNQEVKLYYYAYYKIFSQKI